MNILKWMVLKHFINIVTRNCFMVTIDLKDAYYSVAISRLFQKFLKFKWKYKLYYFICFPNGLWSCQIKFTNVCQLQYLDLSFTVIWKMTTKTFLRINKGNVDAPVKISPEGKQEWWLENTDNNEKYIALRSIDLEFFYVSSSYSWGASFDTHKIGGARNMKEKALHINCKETSCVLLLEKF